MTRTGYELLGFVVWKGGKWYVRRRLRGTGTRMATGALAVGAGAAVVAVIAARRG
jgi:hypothetical protein